MFQAIGLIFLLAIAVEGIIEYLGSRLPSTVKPYAAALLAIAVCVSYGADLLALLGYPARVPFAGEILTGLIIGRGSNYLNSFMKQLSVVQLPAAPVNEVVKEGMTNG